MTKGTFIGMVGTTPEKFQQPWWQILQHKRISNSYQM